jgi:NAD(P)-dependent dehydrogenase (short-subunit alcohol dehydrogenase family)
MGPQTRPIVFGDGAVADLMPLAPGDAPYGHTRAQVAAVSGEMPLPAVAAALGAAAPVPAPLASQDRPRSDVLLDIVAEKTGYPREALDVSMDLESDLGIDSIKRVEILAAANQRMPGLPRLQAEQLSAMRTLAQIAGYLDAASGSVAPAHAAPAAMAAPATLAAPAASDVSGERRAASRIERRLRSFSESPAPGFAPVDLWDGEPTYVVGDPRGLGRALAACLTADGITALAVDTLPDDASRVVLLGDVTADSVPDAIAFARRTVSLVAGRARLWDRKDGLFVTVEPDYDPAQPAAAAWLGGLTALCRTAAAELPRLTARALHVTGPLDDVEAVARMIATELQFGGADLEIRLDAAGRRRQPRLEPAPEASGDLALEPGSVVVVSGGGRGITAEAVVALARRGPLRVLLLGRTLLSDEPERCRGVTDAAELGRVVLDDARRRGDECSPAEVRAAVARIVAAREIRRTIERLHAQGSEARYLTVDVSDARAVASAVESVRRDWGPIAAVLHGAGALADAWLREKTDAHVDRVFAPKLSGIASLLAATANDPLRLVCGFSSVAAHAANPGQADYAMANAILERVLAVEGARRGPSCQVRAIAWGPWDSGMVSTHLRDKFAREGVDLIDAEAGAGSLVRELSGRSTDTTVVLTAGPPWGRRDAAPVDGTVVVAVSPGLFPEVEDHRIKGRMVVPMALVVEWFARLLRTIEPDAACLRLGHLQVLRPVVIPGQAASPVRLIVQYRRDLDRGVIHVVLSTPDGRPCYEGTILSGAEAPDHESAAADVGPVTHVTGVVPVVSSLYRDGPLFHGPRFQVLRALDSVSASFAQARVATKQSMGWPGAYLTDPALVDGALQLALVWAFQATGERCVPMRFGAVEVALDAHQSSEVIATLVAPPISGATLRASVRVTGEAGGRILSIRDVEGYAIPAERASDLPATAVVDVES